MAVSYDYVTDDATSGTIIVQSYNDVSTNLSSINLSETIKSGHVEEVFKIPDTWGNSTNAGVKFLLNNVTGTVRFSNLKLELGNKSTDWSPAPEDIQYYYYGAWSPWRRVVNADELGVRSMTVMFPSGDKDLSGANVINCTTLGADTSNGYLTQLMVKLPAVQLL